MSKATTCGSRCGHRERAMQPGVNRGVQAGIKPYREEQPISGTLGVVAEALHR